MPTMIRSELSYDYGGRYRFVLTADLVVDLKRGMRGFHILQDGGTTWAQLDGDILTIFAGYAFDGCSPAIRIFGKWIGTPTPRRAVAAAAVHDTLRNYLHLPCITYNLKDTDEIFYNLLRECRFDFEDIYHGAVAGFCGRLYHLITASRPTAARCKCHPRPQP